MFLALLLSIGAAVSPPSWADAAPSHPQANATQALSQILTQAVERNDTPGVVGLVVDRKGVLFEGAAGKLDAAGKTALPVNAIFNIASMTKPVTSVAVMMLLEQGKLSLDDLVPR
jgi:CubicO group peptidase (beta-lactamase class C family)